MEDLVCEFGEDPVYIAEGENLVEDLLRFVRESGVDVDPTDSVE